MNGTPYGGLKKAQITPQLKLSPCKPNLRCRNTIVQSRRTDPKGSTSHNIDASPEGFSEGFPVDDVIRFGASPSARGWRKGQWRKGRWGGAGAGQMAPSVGLAQRPTFVSLAGSRPEQLPFLFLAAALCLVQRDDLGSKWRACGQPLLLLQASRPFASCGQIVVTGYSPPASPVKCQKCRQEAPKTVGARPHPYPAAVVAAARG